MATRRHRRRSGKGGRWLFVLLGLGAVVTVLLLLAPMLVMNWVRGYIQKEAFRGQMEHFFGTQLSGSVTLAPLRWTGDEVTTADARASTAGGWSADLSGLHLGLDWNAFRQSKWHIINIGLDSLTLEQTLTPGAAPAAAGIPEPGNTSVPAAAGGSSIPSWLRRYLPTSTEVDAIQVDLFSIRHPGPWALLDSKLRIAPWKQGETSIQVVVDGGIVETPVQLPAQVHPMKFNLTRASARLSREDLHLKDATLEWMEKSVITARGHLRPAEGAWNLAATLKEIPLREILSDDWKLRLTGTLEGDLEIKGGRTTAASVDGDVRLRDGVLTTLPILDRLAAYTGVERFKRLVLDIASSHVRGSGETRQFDRIVIQSNGLVRIEGSLLIDQGRLDGSFLVGVTPETLRWLPGAQTHVFTGANPAGPPGMLWTPLRITGTVDAPAEDLSDRIISGAGKALLDAPGEIAGKGTHLLLSPVLGKEAAAKPAEVIKGAADTATDAAGKAVGTGIKLLDGFTGGLLGK